MSEAWARNPVSSKKPGFSFGPRPRLWQDLAILLSGSGLSLPRSAGDDTLADAILAPP
jgi:hypothetical protein